MSGKNLLQASIDLSEVEESEGVDAAAVPVIDQTNASESPEDIKYVDFKRLKLDLIRNPRFPFRYKVEQIGWLCRSILKYGLRDAIVVSKRADGSIFILKGHLRYHAILILRTDGLKKSGDEPAVEPNPDFMSKVRCRVYTGLTMDGELDLVMDHGETTPLSTAEMYNAARTMERANWSQTMIAAHFGKKRGSYQKLSSVMKMPVCVEELLLADRTTDEGKRLPDLTTATITELYKQYNADRADDKLLRPGAAGPKFQKAWGEFVAKGGTDRSKPLTATFLMEKREKVRDNDVQDLLAAIASGNAQDFASSLTRVEIRLINPGDLVNTGVRVISEGIANTVGDKS